MSCRRIGVPPCQRQRGWVRLDPSNVEGISMKLTTASESTRPNVDNDKSCVDKSRSKDQRQADEESSAETASKPGGFDNDPDDPTNPNEVRERHLKKIKP
jgi:hypothetical protein